MKCTICEHDAGFEFSATVLNKYQVSYFKCNNCGLLFTETPFWLEEAYSSAISKTDTGVIRRNLVTSIQVPILLYCIGLDLKNGIFLDYAGGGGILVRLLRDFGMNYYWNDKFCVNWVANGFEGAPSQKYDAVTSFESFEHFIDPINEVTNLFKLSNTVIFSTDLLPVDIPDQNWLYYSFETGQHISFYSKKTLLYIGKKFDLNYYGFDNVHIFCKNKLSWFKQKLIYFLIRKKSINFLFALFFYAYIRIRTKLVCKISEDDLNLRSKV